MFEIKIMWKSLHECRIEITGGFGRKGVWVERLLLINAQKWLNSYEAIVLVSSLIFTINTLSIKNKIHTKGKL